MSAGRRRILTAACALIHDRGVRAVSVDDIAARAGAGKMTLYRHFPTKDDLVVAALEALDAPAQRRLIAAADSAGADPRLRLLAPFEGLGAWFSRPDFRGCPFMNASLELADPHHPARAVARRHKAATRAHFVARARAAGSPDPEALADQLALLFDGAIAQAHTREPRAVAAAALAAAHTLVAAGLGDRPGASSPSSK